MQAGHERELQALRAAHDQELALLQGELNQMRPLAETGRELARQIQGIHNFRPLFAQRLSGQGIEIGALHNPLPLPPGVVVRYVDQHTKSENIAFFKDLNADAIVETDYVCDGQTLHAVPDESQDFVIANHMLEHCVNPLLALENFLRVLKPQGRLFISLPDKRFIFDFKRPATPWEHILQDYRMQRAVEELSVYEEYRDCVDPTLDVEAALKSRHEIHHHTWTQGEILELFIQARRVLGWPIEIELFGKQGAEVVLVMQKADPPHQDHGKIHEIAQTDLKAVDRISTPEDGPELNRETDTPSQPVAPSVSPKASDADIGVPTTYRVGAITTDRIHVQIEETWSTDLEIGVRGFALVKSGVPQDVQITCEGSTPASIEWHDRGDVYEHAIFAGYARHVRCGFRAGFRRRAGHEIAVTAPGAGVHEPVGTRLPATSFAPFPITEPAGTTLTEFTAMVNRDCRSVLEIGSRIVGPGSQSKRALFASQVQYTGFDIYSDSNTDVVGDAHGLSSYFPSGTRFDAIFSLAVLEHIAMPWKVAMEINKLLPIGGLAFHSTPFTWPIHETPWDFWRFSHEGLRMLFSPALGFEVLAAGLTSPCRISLEKSSGPFWQMPFQPTFAESNILVRKVRDYSPEDFAWNARLEDVLPARSCYPPPKQ